MSTKPNFDLFSLHVPSGSSLQTVKKLAYDLSDSKIVDGPQLACEEECLKTVFHPEGLLVGALYRTFFCLLDPDTLEITSGKISLESEYKYIGFTSTGSFVVVGREAKSAQDLNVSVYCVKEKSLELVKQFTDKLFDKNNFTSVGFFNKDTSLCLRTKTGAVIFSTKDFSIIDQVKLEGVSHVSYPRTNPQNTLLMFFPEKNSKPAQAQIIKKGRRIASKSFFNAQTAVSKWAETSFQAVLVKTETAEDKTGKSYYGQSNLTLFYEAHGGFESTKVEGKSGGGIKDFAWCPHVKLSSPIFVVLSGSQPALASLHNHKGEALFRFGEVYSNECIFNPFGRFLLLAGFGNLPGEMDFWDLSPLLDSTRKQDSLPIHMGKNRATTPVCFGWSAEGRMFMTASTYPRRRVDNCIELFTYFGKKVVSLPYTTEAKLSSVGWRQYSQDTMRAKGFDRGKDSTCPPTFTDYFQQNAGGTLRTKYIPPALRGLAASKQTSGGLSKNVGASVVGNLGVSLDVVNKEKAKRERKKQRKKELAEKLAAPAQSKYNEDERRIRKLTKTLKAVRLLSEKQKAGETLDEAQLLKVSKLEALESELKLLSK